MRAWIRSLPRRDIAIALGLEFLVLFLYGMTLSYPPIWDDGPYLFHSGFLQKCRNLAVVLNPRYLVYNLPVTGAARPVWMASILADTCMYSGAVVGYRLTNLLWFGLGVGALYAFLADLLGDRRAAAFAALLYLVHPTHTETINVISFRADLLVLPLMLTSLTLHRAFLRAKGREAWAALAGAAGCYAAALLAKETAVTLLFLAVLTDRFYPEKKISSRSRMAAYTVLSAVLVLYLVFHIPRSGYAIGTHQDMLSSWKRLFPFLRGVVAPEFAPMPVPHFQEPPMPWQLIYESHLARVLTMSRICGDYLRLLVWPHPLQGDYAPVPVTDWRLPGVLGAWLAWGGLASAAWLLRRRARAAAYGFWWFALSLIPFSGIIALYNPQAERYLFVPSLGICVMAGTLLASWRPKRAREAGSAVLVVITCVFAFLTVARNRDYRSNMAFYEATVRVDGKVPRARFNLGEQYRGVRRDVEAEAEYRAALDLWPEYAVCRMRLAELLREQKREDEADELMDEAPETPARG